MNELNFLDSLFNEVMGCAAPTTSPRVDVIENEGTYTFEMELPGRSEKDVDIELDRDSLKIASKQEEAKETKEDKKTTTKYILKERNTCNFERRFALPDDVDTESICANFKNGILTINMNKKAVTAPKKITIEAC